MADELYWFIAPILLNDQNSISMLGIDKPNQLDNAYHLELVDVQKFKEDILLHYFIQ
jgi:riboflavin biosynthesis pyrimidine reductase